jgi:hypothetical protein
MWQIIALIQTVWNYCFINWELRLGKTPQLVLIYKLVETFILASVDLTVKIDKKDDPRCTNLRWWYHKENFEVIKWCFNRRHIKVYRDLTLNLGAMFFLWYLVACLMQYSSGRLASWLSVKGWNLVLVDEHPYINRRSLIADTYINQMGIECQSHPTDSTVQKVQDFQEKQRHMDEFSQRLIEFKIQGKANFLRRIKR